MKQLLNFILIIIISILFAGTYGILHDQITFTLSPEYYTLLKFPQFGIENLDLNIRIKAGIVGFLATWWVGLFLGIAYASVSIFLDSRKVLKVTLQSILINLCITVVLGISGYFFAVYFLTPENTDWYIPLETVDIRNFINVGSIHNFGYIGGVAGLIVGIIYQIKKAKAIL
ncbi:hypothetical protein OK18_04695 [Chryseobacterium gallinarum]|uniref:Signal peptide-containing protein n=2 Tax=Chryseobacterium gallinarum TaxID=1324352 RepID=A0A0G3LYP4_CHRGL|nr:hypothetical protein [Chryseobacterium gallinarum]AKK72026.1 hypothetical protein OK18_04695 [Chryseobacterium gallinarum]